MKIVHIVSTFPPYHGGMGNSVAGMARALADRRHEVTVLTPRSIGNQKQLLNYSITQLRPLFRFGNAAFLPQLLWQLQGYDVVHLHYPFFGGAEIIALWKRFAMYPKPAPLIVTYHMDAVADGWKGKMFAWHNRHVLPWILKSADRIIVTSGDYAEHSLLHTLPSLVQKIVPVSLGIDATRFDVHRSPLDPPHVLFVGGLDRAHAFKGVDVLLRAFKVVLQFWGGDDAPRLVIVGDGDMRTEYEHIAKELEIEASVTFAGRVSDEELPSYYADASLVVLPSVNESEAFGMVLLEAMVVGRTTIASNLPGVRSVVMDGMTGVLVKPGDIVGLGKTIAELLRDPAQCAKMGTAGRKRVEQEYALDRVGERLEEVYREVQK